MISRDRYYFCMGMALLKQITCLPQKLIGCVLQATCHTLSNCIYMQPSCPRAQAPMYTCMRKNSDPSSPWRITYWPSSTDTCSARSRAR
jgi:hypothetical protein